MEWIYTDGLGSCLMHLLHNGYRKTIITFISNLTKFTSYGKTSYSMCSRRSHYIMWTSRTNSTWSCCEMGWDTPDSIISAVGQLWWVIHFRWASASIQSMLWGNLLWDVTNYLYQIWKVFRNIELTLKRSHKMFFIQEAHKTLGGKCCWLYRTGKLERSTGATDNQKLDLVWEIPSEECHDYAILGQFWGNREAEDVLHIVLILTNRAVAFF